MYMNVAKNVLFRSPAFSYKALNAFKAFFIIVQRTRNHSIEWIKWETMDYSLKDFFVCVKWIGDHQKWQWNCNQSKRTKSDTHTGGHQRNEPPGKNIFYVSFSELVRAPHSYKCMFNLWMPLFIVPFNRWWCGGSIKCRLGSMQCKYSHLMKFICNVCLFSCSHGIIEPAHKMRKRKRRYYKIVRWITLHIDVWERFNQGKEKKPAKWRKLIYRLKSYWTLIEFIACWACEAMLVSGICFLENNYVRFSCMLS